MSGRNISPASSSPGSSADNSFSVNGGRCDSRSKSATFRSSASSSEFTDNIHISIDLVTAARRHLAFLHSLTGSLFLHEPAAILYSIRRYEQIWMPLMAVLSRGPSSVPMLLPPPDVDWVWLCHSLDPERYREYCVSRFGELVDRPSILDEENEEYAADRCREIWNLHHPSEPFELEMDGDNSPVFNSDASSSCELFAVVAKHRELCSFFSDPFLLENVYLVSARQRYLNFLYILKKSATEDFRIVPAADIRLMWHTHKSFPGIYATDMKEIEVFCRRAVEFNDCAAVEEATETTTRMWEAAFDEPYERAGAAIGLMASPGKLFFNWDASVNDVNCVYKCLRPRFLLEVIVFLKGKREENVPHNLSKRFLRMRTVRSHKELKLVNHSYQSSSDQWRKTWHLYCEFGTRGIVIEVCQHGSYCLRKNKLLKRIYFYWNDLLHSAKLSSVRELEFGVRALASLTPPVQAAYLLKVVPDRVTDDVGAMVSDVILRMSHYRPQEGRWLSRTVLDHAGRECFVIRTRVGRGFWRRGAETPSPVNREERIVEVREGQWSYVATSVGYAPEKVVGMATPVSEDSNERKTVWSLSTGDVLTIHWDHGLSFQLQTKSSDQSVVSVQRGRKQQYQVIEANPEEEKYYVTIIRSDAENPGVKATALLNWKLQAAEFSPEEDAVFVLLLNMAILRTMSQVRREDVGGLLVRHRVRQVVPGLRDWGSVTLPSDSSPDRSPHFEPWYWNNAADEVLASPEANDWGQQMYKHSPVEGKDELYRASIIS